MATALPTRPLQGGAGAAPHSGQPQQGVWHLACGGVAASDGGCGVAVVSGGSGSGSNTVAALAAGPAPPNQLPHPHRTSHVRAGER